MPYVLGVDVGNSHTTAALYRPGAEDAAVLPLDDGRPWVHSVLYLTEDDAVLVGRDALARAEAEPERVARDLCARVGDPVAPLVGGLPCPAEMLLATLVRWVVDRAVDREREAPERVVLAHPASWGPHRWAALDAALRQVDLPDVLQLPKPLAAAESYAAANPVTPGDAVAVYDLGEAAMCGAVARFGPAGFDLVSRVETGEPAGGSVFDDLLVGHVLTELGRAPADLDPFDDELRPAMAELRSACRAAKESLSTAPEAVVPTPLLGPPSSVLVSRARFEELIGQAVSRTVDLLQQAIRTAHVPSLAGVTLVGGAARVPLVAELVTAAAPARVVLDADPDTAVARGAALAGHRVSGACGANHQRCSVAEPARRRGSPSPSLRGDGESTPEVQLPEDAVQLPEQRDRVDSVDLDAPTQPPRPPVEVVPIEPPRRGTRRWKAASRGRRRAD